MVQPINTEILVKAYALIKRADDCLLMVQDTTPALEQQLWMTRAQELQAEAQLLLHQV